MVGQRKKKYESGAGAQYMSRKSALTYLQLSLKNFRRLCILKGIYPREPRNRRKAQKGKKTVIQTLYYKKDIQFLLHEPIIAKLRDVKIFTRKVNRAMSMNEKAEYKRQVKKHPTIILDHIIKERYPTFIDALHDLDDCLTLCFLFSTFPSLRHVHKEQSSLCRQLTIEFMHAVIHAQALRKVFVSIKGYYFQIEYRGQTITWIAPHHFSYEPQDKEEVDFRIMSTFVQFYTVLLGFVNFQMYHQLNLAYPPKLPGYDADASQKKLVDEEAFVSERIAALNVPICKVGSLDPAADVGDEIEQFPSLTDNDELEERKAEILKVQKQKTLFKDLKFFINREVPREPLVFAIRCLGGVVSWDSLLYVGATYPENDETITHHIVDRPSMDKQFLSRYYVQPQWVFDSLNACELLPVDKYLMGAVLPPHLSPFVNPGHKQVYLPPEARGDVKQIEVNSDEDEEEEAGEKEASDQEEQKETTQEEGPEGMSVRRGKLIKDDPIEKGRVTKQEHTLREKMIPKKHRKLYKSMMDGRKDRVKEIWLLRKKRRRIDEEKKVEAKEKKRKEKIGV